MNSEERLRDFWQAYDPEHADVFYQYCWEGINGLAWSPDGEWIVYNCLFGIDMVGGNVLLKARVDGTGDIEVVANSSRISRDPCWSPDGKYILFSAEFWPGDYHLFMTPADGSEVPTNLTMASGSGHHPGERPSDGAPAWYGV